MIEEKKQFDRRWLWLGAVLLLVLVFFTTRSLTRERLPVRAAQLTRTELVNNISTNGRVEPEINYEIHSPLSTSVKAVYAQPGDVVPVGKLLLELDDVQAKAKLASAESGVKAAQAGVEAATHNGTQQERQASAADIARARLDRDQARRDLDALTKLSANGAASKSEVAAARQRLDSAETSLHASEESAHSRYSPTEIARAQATLDEAEAGLTEARKVMEQTSVHAPIAGTVYSLDVGHSQFVEEGKMVLQIADLHHVRVRAYFDEPEIGRLAIGQKVQIKWDGNSKPGTIWNGHIVRVPVTVITYGTRNVGEVLVQIDDTDGGLLPDTNVTVTVTTSNEPNAMTIPREALHAENSKYFVYKIVGDGLLRTPVTIGTINLTQVSILSGLTEGEMVATGTSNGQPLLEGVAIKVVR